MQDFIKIISSRTILVLLFLVVFNVANAITSVLDPMIATIITTVLSTIAGYFRINTSVKFDE